MEEVTGLRWPDCGVQRLRLGEVEIDLRYRSVHRGGVAYELNPRCFELLLLFLREPRMLQTREAIFRKVWPGVVVEDANLTTGIWMLRRALGGLAKQWIRTVSKQGYIFDPPASVQLEICEPEPQPAATAAVQAAHDSENFAAIEEPTPQAAPLQSPSPSPPREPLLSRSRAALLALAACLALFLLTSALLHKDGGATLPTRVLLVDASDSAAAAPTRWPAQLLHAWLDWQLRSAPDLVVGDTGRAAAPGHELAVLLSVGMSAQRDGEWQVAARFRGSAAPADIVQFSSSERLVATLDQVSRRTLAALSTRLDAAQAPPLALDQATAAELVDGLDAQRQRRWGEAVRRLSGVVEKSPGLGFARLRLAQSLAELGQQAAAQVELSRAQPWTDALPANLRLPIQAEQALIRREYDSAAQIYAGLLKSGGENAAYRLAEATSLRQGGRSLDAAHRLAGELPAVPELALRWLLEQSQIELANRDLARAGETAARALELARRQGSTHEQARAALLLADIQVSRGQAVEQDLFGQAAAGFDAAGDRLGALRARLYAELAQGSTEGAPAHLDELLAQARSAGNAAVEIDALRRAAQWSYRRGDARDVRARLDQAAAVAESTGNSYERRRTDIDLLREDALRLDFAALENRIAVLRAQPLQGALAYAVGVSQARLHYLRGQYPAALAVLQRTDDLLREAGDGVLPQIAVTVGCYRAIVHTLQGQTTSARSDYRDCRASGLPAFNQLADLGDAELAIQAGDLAEARRLLAPVRARLATVGARPDRWGLSMDLAPLLARSGDLRGARELVEEVLPAVVESGYRLIEADLRITLAEIALAEDRPDDAERQAAAGAALLPADYWYERRRLRTVQALLSQSRGQLAAAARQIDALHADARERGDVLGELLVHSLMDTNIAAAGCPDERRARLVAQSGMRGASDIWMNPAARGERTALNTRP